jgi:hypothetical protein
MSDEVVAAIIGVSGVLVGAGIAGGLSLRQATLAARERQQVRREQNYIAAFQYFDGKTQRRSVGISIIAASWREMPELLPMFVPLLVHQAIYLITQSREKEDAALEYRNLDRIIDLLATSAAQRGSLDGYRELRKILRNRASGQHARRLPLKPDCINAYLELLGETRGHVGDTPEAVPSGGERERPDRGAASPSENR